MKKKFRFIDLFCGWRAEPHQFRANEYSVRCRQSKDPYRAEYIWNHRPAEDAKDKEIESLKAEVTRYRRALHNLKEDCQKRLRWKNSSWERLFLHEVMTHIDAELDFTPDTNVGKMEE